MAELSVSPAGAADAGAFLARLVRLDADALVRLRTAGEDRVTLWARLPWKALVTRIVAGSLSVGDATVAAGALLGGLQAGEGQQPRAGQLAVAGPPRLDARWRWGLPPEGGGRVVESLPAAQLRELGSAAERAVRAAVGGGVAGGRTVGERAVRDALLDHVAVVVRATVNNSTVEQIEVPQRLVQAVVRMGFLRPLGDAAEPPVHVLVAGRFIGLAAEYGVAWHRPASGLDVRAII